MPHHVPWTYGNREARILARRRRIQERVATAHQGDTVGGKDGEKEEIGKGKQQIIESKRRLFRVKHRTEQDVTSVRVGGDDREQLHRIQEERTRQVRKGQHGMNDSA